MNAWLQRLQIRQPRWLHLELRPGGGRGFRLVLPLEPFETPIAFVLAFAGWMAQRKMGVRGGWRLLFAPPRLGLERLRPDEPLLEVKSRGVYVAIRIGGLL
ncbi:hypothetical protein [Oceanithermus sp.]